MVGSCGKTETETDTDFWKTDQKPKTDTDLKNRHRHSSSLRYRGKGQLDLGPIPHRAAPYEEFFSWGSHHHCPMDDVVYDDVSVGGKL